jgi:hypothetical protein
MTSDAKKDTERLAQLEAEVAALKASLAPKPEPKLFVPQPYQRYDPTAGMSMPRSAIEAMIAAEPKGFMSGVVRDNRAPTSPGMIPSSHTSGGGPANVPGSGTGWQAPTQLGPPPGVNILDRIMDHEDAKDRAELIEREARFKAIEEMAEQTEAVKKRTEALAKLAEQMK